MSMQKLKSKTIVHLALTLAAVSGMGISMPSCPGQQAMQQQVDALKTSEAEFKTKIASLEKSNKAMAESLESLKSLVTQQGTSLEEIKAAIQKLESAPKGKSAPAAAARGRGGKKR